MNGYLELAGGIRQPGQKNPMIIIIAKNHPSVVAALDDVMGLVGDDKTGKSGHGRKEKVAEKPNFKGIPANYFDSDPN
ncbi:hypothetical protein QN362_09125 [Actimicrobium sp. CCC2.4]|uniref:hypothetical protein n=1 Tax=Actimicrobium sp. CCC2.4 TaxID=3048606 RepID=UPI002AC89A42|nr:hypothetical protein [Actimicrobium sp. CCC2.4]MEB0135490.1 hypothetical protein [Actimicrobium sp. CCC2.4]WPX34236.1 hypothetical protein RHM62_00360 [Actimicrobium sp. CCC2.4]